MPFKRWVIPNSTFLALGGQQLDNSGPKMREKGHLVRAVCRKYFVGKVRCRLAMPRGLVPTTKPVRLARSSSGSPVAEEFDGASEPPLSSLTTEQALLQRTRQTLTCWELKRPALEPLKSGEPVMTPPIRALTPMWVRRWLDSQDTSKVRQVTSEKLQTSNGPVVSVNPVMLAATGAHNNAELLGGTEQSNGAMLYVAPYMDKDKFRLAHAATILKTAMRDVQAYPSTLHRNDETEEAREVRTTQHMLTRWINKLNLLAEVSDVQAASVLLGYSTETTSESFIGYNSSGIEEYVSTCLSGRINSSTPQPNAKALSRRKRRGDSARRAKKRAKGVSGNPVDS